MTNCMVNHEQVSMHLEYQILLEGKLHSQIDACHEKIELFGVQNFDYFWVLKLS